MRLIVVSNRLPLVLKRREGGKWESRPGSGGLVTALSPVLQQRGGIWIGWIGSGLESSPAKQAALQQATREAGYELRPVDIPANVYDGFYRGFANESIWPLFHDLPSLCRFDPEYWLAAEKANARFAAEVARCAKRSDDFIWVHDYHLMGAARAMREQGIRGRIAFFLHIPFPPVDLFMKLPWRFQVLRDLLQFDLVGLQTPRDRRNFLQCVRFLAKDARVHSRGNRASVRLGSREVRIGAFPIGIDYKEFAEHAVAPGVTNEVQRIRVDERNRCILLGVDRLDYTKGLRQRLQAFARALDLYPELRGRINLAQFVVPSREDIPRYAQFKRELEQMVGEINGRFTRSGWVPVHHVFRALDRSRLVAWYRASDVALVTPLKDGMNLVAKEYCAANPSGVLVLSEFAGAAAQLQQGALLVNPHDLDGMATAIARAVDMPTSERRARMRKMRRAVREHDIFWWLDSFLKAATSKTMQDSPALEEFVPTRATNRGLASL
jgi:alpha,alpha-trehalose-phosphate synthase [UDP-forming]